MTMVIKKHHLEKTAFVYLRQSSPTQVKKNLEGSASENVRGTSATKKRIPHAIKHKLNPKKGTSFPA